MRLVNELDAIKNKTHKTGGKKMKKKKVFALMMAATLALSLAGCGGSSSGDSKSSGSSDSSSVANKDKPLCWFNRQPSNSSTGELDKEALNFNKDTYYVGFDANQGAELQGEMVVDYIKANADKIDRNGDGVIGYVLAIGDIGHNDSIARTRGVRAALGTGVKEGDEVASKPAGTNVDGKAKVVQDAKIDVDGKEFTVRELASQEMKNSAGATWDAATAGNAIGTWEASFGDQIDIVVSSLSYERAREAVSYRVLYGTKRAINIGEIVPKEQIKPVQSEESRMQTLFRAIRIGDSAEIERAAYGEMEKLHKNTETMSQYNLATMEIVSGFFKFCTDNSLDFNKISGNMQNIYEKVSQMDESSLTAWIVQMSKTISEKLKCARNSSARRLIVEAQNIVQERYMEADISLDEVCAVLGVSNSYFSSVFKKEAGKSFISYLTDYRMDIAAEMILNTDEKSYTIAEKVGYLDANYFSYVFKKKFGVSPSKYRASVK